MTKKQDVAVIGGGIIGVATAFYLKKSEAFNVSLYDDSIGQATKATGGVVSPWLSRRRNKTWYKLVKTAAAFYPTFIDDIGLTIDNNPFYRKTGSLLFKKKDEHLEEMLDIGLKRRETAPEIGDLRILTAKEIKDIFPIYTGTTRALYASGGAKVDGKYLIQYMLEHLENIGVNIIKNRVHAIKANIHNQYALNTATDEQLYAKVVVANGAWAPKLIEPLGFHMDNDMQKGQIAEIVIPHSDTFDWPVVQPAGGFNVVPFAKGHILIGATHEKDTGYTLDIIPDLILPYIDEASRQISTTFSQAEKVNYRVGVRAYTSDYSPYFGKISANHDIYTANGMGATGLTAGPLIGKILTQLMLDQQPLLNPDDYPTQNYIFKN